MRPFLSLSLASLLLSKSAFAVGLGSLSSGDLVISEVFPYPAAVAYNRGQWFEVYNNAGVEVDLDGLVVTNGDAETFTVSGTLTVADGEYAVFAVRANSAVNGGITTVDYAYSFASLSLRVGGDSLTLSFGGTTFDSVTYDNDPDPYGASVNLAPAALDAADNDTATNWCTATSTYGDGDYGTPGSANTDCAAAISTLSAGDLIVTEVMVDPASSDYNKGEWFEIYNASGAFVDIAGLTISDGTESFSIVDSVEVRPDEYVLLAARDNPLQNGGMDNVDVRYFYGADMTLLSSDTITLSFGGTTFDSVSWDGSFPGSSGVAMELANISFDAASNDSNANWCDASIAYGDGDLGTPGEANGDCDSDSDGDGYTEDVDCDDDNAAINPGADEICDGIDNDCDDQIDNTPSDGDTFYADTDGDGYGDPGNTTVACTRPSGYRTNSADCDDASAAINPGAAETCDGIDDNCSGDESDAADATAWYADSDGDGYGDTSSETYACAQPSGTIADGTDCDDTAANVNPGEAETCDGTDNNCSGDESDASDTSTFYADTDSDGYGDPGNTTDACTRPSGYRPNSLDCDDADGSINPGATELCDGIDDNCSGDEYDAADGTFYYHDVDGDGYGDNDDVVSACSQPANYILDNTDCDDTTGLVNPGEAEVCDGTDNNCSGDESDASDTETFYADLDDDKYGDPFNTTDACIRPSGYRTNNTDCDDTDISINPGADETCDGTDNNCSGDESDATDATAWHTDSDGDGYGDTSSETYACVQPSGTIADGTDCDDAAANVNPGEAETCDGTDNNCSGDESDASDTSTFYADTDSDGYGDPGNTTDACTRPSGYRPNNLDCDDAAANINPGEAETCDGTDNNCSGDESDASDLSTWYADADSDGYGDIATTTDACFQPSGYLADSTDCDDVAANVNPGEVETCDGTDNNCSGDESDATDATTWYADADGDGYGDSANDTAACSQPSGYLIDGTDCDDAAANVNPGEAETCDGTDNNCSGDESDASDIVTWFADVDTDGYGDSLNSTDACFQPSGYLADDSDCDDAEIETYPGAPETCNDGVDSDCDSADSNSTCDASLSNANASVYGESELDLMGYALAAGDLDGDGFDDILTGARLDDQAGADAGAAYIFHGPLTGSHSASGADYKLTGEAAGDYAAISIDAADMNHDGYDDIIVGSLNEATGGSGAGAVYMFLGPLTADAGLDNADAKWTGAAAGDSAGRNVASAGDVDNDGNEDFIVGASNNDDIDTNAGAAYLLYGPVTTNGSLASADAIFTGVSGQDRAGYWLDGAGDVDGDGYDDVLIGAYRADTTVEIEGNIETTYNTGASYVVFGPASGTIGLENADITLRGEALNDQAGSVVAGAGDIDGDGYHDLLIGARHVGDADAGMVYLVYGSSSLSGEVSLGSADASFSGEADGDQAGRSIDGVGDVNLDGHGDILIGAYKNDASGADSGAAYLLLGPFSGTTSLSAADGIYAGEDGGDQAGVAVFGGGDISGDGTNDILVGASSGGTGGTNGGALYMLFGEAWQ